MDSVRGNTPVPSPSADPLTKSSWASNGVDLDVFSTLPKNPDPATGKNPVVPHVVRTFSRDAATVQSTPSTTAAPIPKPPMTPASELPKENIPPPTPIGPQPPTQPTPPAPPVSISPVIPKPQSVWLSAPSAETKSVNSVPETTPAPPQSIVTPTTTLDPVLSTKNEILERLRAKTASRVSDALLFETEGENAPSKNTPTFAPKREIPSDSEKISVPLSPTGLSPLHTYRLDFAGRIRDKKASPFTILAAEQDSRKLHEAVQTDIKRRKIWYIAGALLIVLGGGGGYATYHFIESGTSIFPIGSVPSLIFADDQKRIEGTAVTLQHAIAQNASEDTVPRGAVRVLFATVSSTTPNGVVSSVVAGNALFEALQLPAPSILTRNIEPQTTIGVINADDDTRPFFILKVSSYGSTFSGMLQWESTMAKDLALFYPAYPPEPAPQTPIRTATTTVATSTPPLFTAPKTHPEDIIGFSDGTVANNSVRILLDRAGRTIMLYGYRDKTTLIIAGNEAAFTEIVRRLAATSQQ